jgi:hypothetical protein
MRRHRKKINQFIGVLNKHQNERKNSINREINELNFKIENIKEEVTHDMENIRMNKKETKNSGRPLQQTRISRRQNLRTQR